MALDTTCRDWLSFGYNYCMHERTIGLHLPRIRGSHTDTTSETEEGYRSKLHKKSKFRTDHEKN